MAPDLKPFHPDPVALDAGEESARLIDEYQRAVDQFAELVAAEMNHQADKPARKTAAIRRIMGTQNPLTQAPHSGSSAEKVVELDEEYRHYLWQGSNIVVEKIKAEGRVHAALRRADLALARFRATGGLR